MSWVIIASLMAASARQKPVPEPQEPKIQAVAVQVEDEARKHLENIHRWLK